MKAKLENGTMKFYKTKEVEVEKLTPLVTDKFQDVQQWHSTFSQKD